ncbi:mediator complex, subunit Med4 [Pyrenochaeta sp. MPI-SDFR-AT-0127]|nr:mediator complex, subunit Med4 [Pyrenochaeta sp. MPI-SDFR-AT-0127]
MDTVLVEQFERVEKALGALVDSIAAYNPSPQAALDLVAADDDLAQGLDQLARHQANHARIQALRAEADALDEQLKSSVEKLATLRHELFETPATTFPETSRAVPFDELLQYANYISKHTVPPTYRERVPEALSEKDKEKEDAVSSGAPTNGVNTPAIIPESAEPPREETEGQKDGDKAIVTAPEITAEEEEWLKKLNESQMAWYPWPSNEKIRLGNLYKLMYYREKNYNLDEFDIPAFEEEDRLKSIASAEPALEEQEQGQQPPPVQRQPRPREKQEAFTLFDDMDEED